MRRLSSDERGLVGGADVVRSPAPGEDNPYRSWGFPPGNGPLAGVAFAGNRLSSGERMLAGAGRGCGGCPPTNEGSSELATSAARLLRRRQPLRGLGLSSGERPSHRSWIFGNPLSSCEGLLAGAGRGCGGCPPAKPTLTGAGTFLRGTGLSTELRFR